jgi:ATP-dependent RNA helicase RhlE
VLAPTRELAIQISRHAQRFAGARGLGVAVLTGGVDHAEQERQLPGANLLVATPGRLIDHLRLGTLALDQIEVLVLDEAARMLDLGFKPQLRRILGRLPPRRQTMLFSAPLGPEGEEFAATALRKPVRVELAPSGTTAERAVQVVYELGQPEKGPLLLQLLADRPGSTLVFVRTRRRADKLTVLLQRAGHSVERIHADRSQGQRRYALEGFRAGRLRVLIATDIAARGIDVAGIAHVVNYDLPHAPEDYVHRVGRTARASASGQASSFAAPEEKDLLVAIEALLRAEVPRQPVPRDEDVFQKAVADDRARQADPGPPQADAGQSTRPPGQPMGRHARTHRKKPRSER